MGPSSNGVPHNVARAERGVELDRVGKSASSPSGLRSGYGRRGNETAPHIGRDSGPDIDWSR